ncbi:MAG: NfeD family protein [Thermoleophilia bacterium]|nr:NfeD family protein [Thermoleophilia bacterium]MDH3724247.1 NfeD family protein [Thermoleophilia bacterium]
MQEIAILTLLATAVLLGGGVALSFRFIELAARVPVIGDGLELVGERGVAASAILRSGGWIVVQNQLWRAALAEEESPLAAGTAVNVVAKLDGLVLVVEPLEIREAEVVAFPARATPFGDRAAA